MGQDFLKKQYVCSPLVLTDTDLEVWRIYTYFPAFYRAPLFIEYPSGFYPERAVFTTRPWINTDTTNGWEVWFLWVDGWMDGWMDG